MNNGSYPSEAREFNERELNKLSELEKYIDERLADIRGNSVRIYTSDKDGIYLRISRFRKEIIKKYSGAGWKVEHKRKGMMDYWGYLEFRPK